MVKILRRLRRDLKKIKKGEEPDESHIVFKQRINCGNEEHTNYYLLHPEKGE